MRKKAKHALIIFIGFAAVFLASYTVFLLRPPVIIVADRASALLCGEARIKRESALAAFSLFRRVKTVFIADDADIGIIPYAVAEAAKNPHCVLFPLRYAGSAAQYRGLNPDITVIILEGRTGKDSNPAARFIDNSRDYYIYRNDIGADFYKAGLAARYINGGGDTENNGKIVVFLESEIHRQGREAFLSALNGMENPPEPVFFTSFSQYSEIPGTSCMVIAGTGAEIFEDNPGIPAVFFTWTDPFLLPDEAVLVFDDTPWAQAVQAVKMAERGIKEGEIESKLIFRNPKKISPGALHKTVK